MSHKIRAAIAAAIILWASAFVGIRYGLHGYSPEGLALLRYLVASVLMGVIYFMMPERSKIDLVDKIKLFTIGIIGIGIYSLMLNYGEISVSSGVASFITAQSPALTAIFAIIFLGETLTVQRVAGFLVSMIGVVFIAYGEIGEFTLTPSLLYVLAAMLAGSCYSIMQKPLLKKCNAIEATTYVVWGGTLFLLFHVGKLEYDVVHASIPETLTVVYLGIFPAALAYIAWNYVLQNMSVSHVVSYMYTMPFVAAIMGWMLLGETPAVVSVIGAMIAIAGVWLVNQSYQTAIVVEDEPEKEAA